MKRPPIIAAVALLLSAAAALACPFCSSVAPTFTQELSGCDVALIVQLARLPPRPSEAAEGFIPGLGEEIAKSTFTILEVIKGQEHVGKAKEIDAIYFGESPVGTQFMVMGLGPLPADEGAPRIDDDDEPGAPRKDEVAPQTNGLNSAKVKDAASSAPRVFTLAEVAWGTPIELNARTRKYIADLQTLPEKGADRLAFFLPYLEDQEDMLKRDAYDEFAIAPYDDIKALAPRIDHAELLRWIANPEVNSSHRRLYFTLLGVCGTQADLPQLEAWMRSKDRKVKTGLDAMIGCYLALKGPDGAATIEDIFFKDPKTEFIDINAAINAVRVAEEAGIFPRERAAVALRHVLDRPDLADLVITDLARWEDWDVKDRLVELFIVANPEVSWVRTPVVRYLRACPLPEAKAQLLLLEAIDRDAVIRARSYLPLTGGPKPTNRGGNTIETNSSNLPDASAAPADGLDLNEDDAAPAKSQGGVAISSSGPHGGAKVPGGAPLVKKMKPSSPPVAAANSASDSVARDATRERGWITILLVALAVCLTLYGVLFMRHARGQHAPAEHAR